MKLYNSLSRQIEDFTPLHSEKVSVYSCGPTVYDHIHIGNLSAFIYADTLRRTLKLSGLDIRHIMNLTDVDDKTIRRSQEKYSGLEAMEALQKLTSEYAAVFFNDMRAVGNDVGAYDFTKATDYIPQMQTLIRELYEKGFAYVTADGIYFSIATYKASGKRYGQLVEITESSTSEARIANDEYDKDNAQDFALWKKQKPGEPAWDFTIDGHDLRGRPGWHIECSAMSTDKLGQPFDIHTGGVDLIFPHHENEIAQSTAGKTSDKLANVFVHNEHILVDGQKMSKSLNNFYTLQDITKKGYDPLAFRVLVLQSHYRNQAHFSWENLEAAQNRLKDMYAWADLRHQPSIDVMPEELDNLFEETRHAMLEATQNDLNTPEALAALNRLIAFMTNSRIPGVEGIHSNGTLKFMSNLLGIPLDNRPDITAEQKQVISEREKARVDKDWTKSDELRDRLKGQGIGLRDTDFGTQWYRLNS